MIRRALRPLARSFEVAEPYIAAALFVGGLVGLVATGFGWQPPVWVIAVIGWILVAREGHDMLGDWLDDEVA